MTIADKLVYLNDTKQLLKDSIVGLGHYLDENSTFREYIIPLLGEQSTLLSDFRSERHKLYEDQSGVDVTSDGLGLSDLYNFTRGSTATRFNRLGILEEVAIDVQRTEHDPSSLNTSLSTVDLDTLYRNTVIDMTTVSTNEYVKGDTVTVTDNALDTNYFYADVVKVDGNTVTLKADKVSGTGSISDWTLIKSLGLLIEEQRTRLNTIAAAPTAPEDVTVTATAHTISFYGAGAVDLTGVATETLEGAGADERVTLTFTPTAGTLTLTPSGTVTDLQLEAGSFATSVIRGEGSQVTRAADNCSRMLGAEFNMSEGTWVAEFKYNPVIGVNGQVLFYVNPPKRIAYFNGTSLFSLLNRAVAYPNNPLPGGVERIAASGGPLGGFLVRNGSSIEIQGQDFTEIFQGSLTLGRDGITHAFTVKKLLYIPRALPEAELIALTTPEAN